MYTDGWILNSYPDQFELAGTFSIENKYSYVFTELTDAYIIVKIDEFDESGSYAYMLIPNEFAYELAMEIQAIEADEDSDLLDTYRFDWQSSGIRIWDTKLFLEEYFGTFENPSYIVLSFSLLIGYLYFCIYHFQKLRYRLKVNTYYGLSKELNNRNLFLQQIFVSISSLILTLLLTSLSSDYSLVTWQEVYIPIYIAIIIVLSLIFPALLIYRNNRWLEKSRGGN